MNQKFDVVALDELLIDFTQNGVIGQGNPLHTGENRGRRSDRTLRGRES